MKKKVDFFFFVPMTAARRGLNRRSAGSALRRGLLGEGALKAPLEGRDARRPGVLGARGGDAGLASRLRNVELEAAWPGPGPVASPGPRPLRSGGARKNNVLLTLRGRTAPQQKKYDRAPIFAGTLGLHARHHRRSGHMASPKRTDHMEYTHMHNF
jgi:hypothetical protein